MSDPRETVQVPPAVAQAALDKIRAERDAQAILVQVTSAILAASDTAPGCGNLWNLRVALAEIASRGAPKEITCSFCSKNRREVAKLIAAYQNTPRAVYICNECVGVCLEVLAKEMWGGRKG